MRLEVWHTLAAIGTFLVVVATAVAVFIQLRHLRVNNQLQALLAETNPSPEIRPQQEGAYDAARQRCSCLHAHRYLSSEIGPRMCRIRLVAGYI